MKDPSNEKQSRNEAVKRIKQQGSKKKKEKRERN